MRTGIQSTLRLGYLIVCLYGGLALCGVRVQAKVDFNRDIRPILSENCFRCHGPDENKREGGSRKTGALRLDTQDGSTMDLGGYAAVVPGKPGESELIYLVTTDDVEDRMPPAKEGRALNDREIDLLKTWIQEGGKYDLHWSYQNPEPPAIPEINQSGFSLRNPVDNFIAQKLMEEGLDQSPEADPFDLARRVALDLTGLPPSLEEVNAFISDQLPGAYERFVNRQLGKPAYGEHWSRMWLDLARYADSAGYADDPLRTIWAYRDYVIRSFNENKPFDQFTIEQIAGDMLPNPTPEQLVATAFHRNTKTNSEGGTNDEEFRNEAVVDRVNTTMAVWMGTTIDCAQCHTHKYDPITQEEYFKMFAILNNTADEDRKDEKPLVSLYTEKQSKEINQLKAELSELRKTIKVGLNTPEAVQRRWQWEKQLVSDQHWTPLHPSTADMLANSRARMVCDKQGIITVGDNSAPQDNYTITVEFPASQAALTAIRLEAMPHDDLWVLNEFEVRVIDGTKEESEALVSQDDEEEEQAAKKKPGIPKLPLRNLSASFEQEWYEVKDLVDGNTGDRFTGWAVKGQLDIRHEAVFEFKEPLSIPEGGKLQVKLFHNFPNKKLKQFRLSVTCEHDPMPAIPTHLAAVLAKPGKDRSNQEEKALVDFFAGHDPQAFGELAAIAEIEARLADIKPLTTVPVMREVAANQQRKTHIQLRGSYTSLGAEVNPGTPAVFPPLPEGSKPDRLGLAHWLVDRKNPLTARVVVNRYWEAIFGIGLVATSEDFGSQGELPSHPQLLDWLAVELMESGWDLKHLLKLLVNSATYRQSSKVTPALLEHDPDNRLLARGPRFRISAETIRDQALAVSGLLSQKRYGPSVKPPQPELGLKAAFGGATDWKTSDGEDRYRRAIYTSWRRSNPYPSMAAFDAPNREFCTVRRENTNTPLQALVTLNDPVYIEASQALSRRMQAVQGSPEDKAAYGFRLCLIRTPSEKEVAALTRLFESMKAHYTENPSAAETMATDPIGDLPEGADVAEYAAWTVVANALLNLDEMFLKR